MKHIDTCQGPKRKYRCIQPGCTQEFAQRSIMADFRQIFHVTCVPKYTSNTQVCGSTDTINMVIIMHAY